jgi:flavin-binding monooxygenase-like protein
MTRRVARLPSRTVWVAVIMNPIQETPLHSFSNLLSAGIGAGAYGFIAAKCLLEAAIEPVVFEQTERIGGLWNYAEDLPDGGSPAYRSLRTNTSKQLMALSDYPFPEPCLTFPTGRR